MSLGCIGVATRFGAIANSQSTSRGLLGGVNHRQLSDCPITSQRGFDFDLSIVFGFLPSFFVFISRKGRFNGTKI